MIGPAGDASGAEQRSLWMAVLRWPLRGGMLGGVLLLTALAVASAFAEGGYTTWQREQRAWVQAGVLFAAISVLGHYAWRAVACTFPAERPVPWFGDAVDDVPALRKIGFFFSVILLSFLPAALWLVLRRALDPAPWLDWTVVAVTCAWGANCLPFGLAGAVVQGSALAALPGTVLRVRRAEPYAARIASVCSMAFVGLLVSSMWLAATYVKHPKDSLLPGDLPKEVPDMVGSGLRAALIVIRASGFYAALVSFRVAGLLVRDVPQVREVLR